MKIILNSSEFSRILESREISQISILDTIMNLEIENLVVKSQTLTTNNSLSFEELVRLELQENTCHLI